MTIPEHRQRQALQALSSVLNRIRAMADSEEDYKTIYESIDMAEGLVDLLWLDGDNTESFRLYLKHFEERYEWSIALQKFEEK